jgi:serine/threonine protein kinase
MDIEERLKQFELDNVIPVNPSDDLEFDFGRGSYGFVVEMNYRGLKCAGKKFYRDLYCQGNVEAREHVITRCYEECLLLCSLSHPNIVQFIGITSERGNPLPILVMEFVPFTLSTLLDKEGILPKDISYGILVDVSMGLCYLHGRKSTIIHRDLSANNILLTSEMKAKIADLGMAKILNATPAKSKCPGTATYMPPEALVENPEYRTEIDVFSYGILTIHVFCGQWPHPGVPKKCDKYGRLVAQTEYERRSKYMEMIGDKHPMIRLIRRCLSDEPTERPNADEILRYTRDSASQFPREFESILDARKHISSMTYNLHSVEEKLNRLDQETTKVKLDYDMLDAKFQRCESERSLLSKKLDDEKKRCSNKERQHHLTLKLKEEEYEKDLQEKRSLLDIKELEIHGSKEMIQAYRTVEIKIKSSERDLTETMEPATKSELDRLRTQIDSLRKQLDTKTCENEVVKKGQRKQQEKVGRILATSKELLENMKLELKIEKTCEISNLKAELEIKENDIRKLRSHQERAQDYLASKVRVGSV